MGDKVGMNGKEGDQKVEGYRGEVGCCVELHRRKKRKGNAGKPARFLDIGFLVSTPGRGYLQFLNWKEKEGKKQKRKKKAKGGKEGEMHIVC